MFFRHHGIRSNAGALIDFIEIGKNIYFRFKFKFGNLFLPHCKCCNTMKKLYILIFVYEKLKRTLLRLMQNVAYVPSIYQSN